MNLGELHLLFMENNILFIVVYFINYFNLYIYIIIVYYNLFSVFLYQQQKFGLVDSYNIIIN
jgi:hypothetical protein